LERRVVLLSRDTGLASIVGLALANGHRVAHLRSPGELTDWSRAAVAAVVLDSRPPNHQLAYKQVRARFRGPLVMLLDRHERRPNLPPDGARRYLHRPFSAADLAAVLAAPPSELGVLENAIIDTWARHATRDPLPRPDGLAYRTSWRPSTRRRVRIWVASVAAMMGLLVVFNLSDQGPCGPGCTSFGASVAGASESRTPLTSRPPSQGGGSGGGSSTPTSGPGPAPGGVPLVSGIGDLIQGINPITSTDTTPPSGPEPVPGVPSPNQPPTGPPATTPPGPTPPTTSPPTTAPPTTAPPTTAPPTTEPPTTAPPTTEPPTTEPPTTEPPTTAPPTTEPPTTAPPTTEPPTTEPPTTAPPTTEPPTTAPPTTEPPTTAPPSTAPPSTASPTT
jgi:hypothetical protein